MVIEGDWHGNSWPIKNDLYYVVGEGVQYVSQFNHTVSFQWTYIVVSEIDCNGESWHEEWFEHCGVGRAEKRDHKWCHIRPSKYQFHGVVLW